MSLRPLIRQTRRALSLAEVVLLVVIAIATAIATLQEILLMVEQGGVRLADLLLLFIYTEVLSMVGIYLQSGKLPVRLPLYIGMVALARYLILDIKDMDQWRILSVSGGVLILAVSVLVLRYGHIRFPYEGENQSFDDDGGDDEPGRKNDA